MSPPTRSQPHSDRIRVVTLVNRLGGYGGAERLALSVATGLDPQRFDSTLCVSRWPHAEYMNDSTTLALEQLADSGVRLLGLGRQAKHDAWVWGRLLRFLKRERVDVLHSHMFGSNVWGTVLGRTAGVPVVLAHEHSWNYQGHITRRLLDRYVVSRGSDALIAVSREDQRRMIHIENVHPEDVLYIPNAISPRSPKAEGDVRAELGIPSDEALVGSVGSLYPVKGFELLITAVALLEQRGRKVNVVIAGEGGERPVLESLKRELGVGDRVHLLGPRPDVPNILNALDVAVCCSYSEGCPLSVMEYMHAGVPVVSTWVGGVPDLIEGGVHGLLIPPGMPMPWPARSHSSSRTRIARRPWAGAQPRDSRRSSRCPCCFAASNPSMSSC